MNLKINLNTALILVSIENHLMYCTFNSLSLMNNHVYNLLHIKNKATLKTLEIELSRMFRTEIFNIMGRLKVPVFRTNAAENRVLLGKANKSERKLKHRSPAVQELIFDNHSYSMLAIGQLRVEPVAERIAYLEAAYTAPEEILFEIGVGVGILGLSKDYLNAILMPKEGMAKRIHIPLFKMPEMETRKSDWVVEETLPSTAPKYTETPQTRNARICQCKLWRRYVTGLPVKPDDRLSINMDSTSGNTPLLSTSNEAEPTDTEN